MHIVIPTKIKSKELVEKRREQIILAAIKLFSKKGFYKTTLRELAEEAGISHGNIYDYVGTKEDIFFLLYKFMDSLAKNSLTRSIENIDDPLEKLRRMVRSEFNVNYQWADAVLLVYQEGHILRKPLLKKLLEAERGRLRKFEVVLEDCINKGRLREFNLRVAANLIKVMLDSWVLKRWDLRGHITQLEMEESVLDLLFHGLVDRKGSDARPPQAMEMLEGKLALVLNGGTLLGKAISSFLLSKGMKLAIHGDDLNGDNEFPVFSPYSSEEPRLYPITEYGQITAELFNRIESNFGPIDILIHDLGISYTGMSTLVRDKVLPGKILETNFHVAQNMAISLEKKMINRGSGRILFLAPWAWDRYADPLQYETIKACTVTHTKIMAKRMAAKRINVNCIVPGFIGGRKPLTIEKEKGSELINYIPLGCLGEIPDVMEAVYFLISDSSKYLTGQVLEVAGGVD